MPGFEGQRITLEALRMLIELGGAADDHTAAMRLWPNSRLWKEPARVPGPGGFREMGVKLNSVAAALFGRLAKRRLVQRPRKGFTVITAAGRAHVERANPKPESPPPAPTAPAVAAHGIPPHPAYAPAGTRLSVFDPRGARYSAAVVDYSGSWVLVRYDNGDFAWIDPRSALLA